MQYGIQLFGVLKDDHNTLETLRRLRSLGFARIEPCLSLEPLPGMEHVIWPIDWLKTHFNKIRDMGLEILSAHIFVRSVPASLEALKQLRLRYGIRQFVVKSPEDLTPESLQQTALTYMQTADALDAVDAELLLHNEAADIQAHIQDKTAYEHLLSLCLGKVGAQVDAGWVYYGGEDPEALLWRLGPLVKSLHYKDFRKEKDMLVQTAVGMGLVDTLACFQFARAMGIPQLIDQDAFEAEPEAELRGCLEGLSRLGQSREHTVSYLNTLDVETGEIRVLKRFDHIIEAPNWLKKQESILFNSEGHIYRYDLTTGAETRIESGICDNCNNDHVVSADEQYLAVSHSRKEEGWMSRVYVLPISGGQPRLVTPNAPSFLHGWSPDSEELAYCAFRQQDGKLEVDIYAIPAAGGEEKRLTCGGFNDGPEYSPNGKQIWFNSTRTGLMQIWRMNRDGSEQTQMTHNERNNWFGHVSPDGTKVVYLSYRKGDLEAGEHLPNMQVELWMMNADGTDQHRLISLFGGQGTINVNSWAADSRHIAFVSYELTHK